MHHADTNTRTCEGRDALSECISSKKEYKKSKNHYYIFHLDNQSERGKEKMTLFKRAETRARETDQYFPCFSTLICLLPHYCHCVGSRFVQIFSPLAELRFLISFFFVCALICLLLSKAVFDCISHRQAQMEFLC